MKKFLVYLLAVVLVAAMGFAIFFLVRDNETLSITTQSLYKEVGDEFVVGLNTKSLKSYTTISVGYSGKTDSVKVLEETIKPSKNIVQTKLQAIAGCKVVRINFQTNNSKFRNLYCDVFIGDGSAEFPYQISSAEQLHAIGREGEEKYTNDKYYTLVNDINCALISGGYWDPIAEFSGHLDGNGFAIKNLNISAEHTESTDLGLFGKITKNAGIDNLVFENVEIHVGGSGLYRAGTVAAENNGTLSRINIKNVKISSDNEDAYIGGVVAENTTPTAGSSIARIDRVSANVDFAYESTDEELNVTHSAIKGTIGGLTAVNHQAIIINSYSVGDVILGSSNVTEFAGIAFVNSTTDSQMRSVIKDCYSAINIEKVSVDNQNEYVIAGVVFDNSSTAVGSNRLIGNYYLSDMCAQADGETINTGFADTEYSVIGYTLDELTSEDARTTIYVSSKKIETRYVDNSIVEVATEEDVLWDFDITWRMSANVNNGLPTLTFSQEKVDDGIDYVSDWTIIDSVESLKALMNTEDTINKKYSIVCDIDMTGEEWIPMGTEENPFQGIISVPANISSVTISNLNIKQSSAIKNGAFIAYMGSNGKVSGLTFENLQVSEGGNYKYAAGIVAYNGTYTYEGGTIENCAVVNSSIHGTSVVGGIVGFNYGIVSKCIVKSADEGETIIAIKPTERYAYIGGIAGQNASTIAGSEDSFVQVLDNVAIVYHVQLEGAYIYMGGIAGTNSSVIKYAIVNTTNSDNYGLVYESGETLGVKGETITGGGIVGRSWERGSVRYSKVSTRIALPYGVYDANKTDSSLGNGGVGGIAGEIMANKSNFYRNASLEQFEDNYAVFGCEVINTYLNGTITGGIVGTLNVYNVTVTAKEVSDTYENYTLDTTPFITIASTMVKDTTLDGNYNGGLAGNIISGVIADCAAENIIFSGNNNAGFAIQILRNPSGSDLTTSAGVIARCYGTFKFVKGNCYEESMNEVHNATSLSKKNYGFIVDHAYKVLSGSVSTTASKLNKDKGFDKVKITGDFTSDLFNSKGWNVANWAMKNLSGATSYWALDNGSVTINPMPKNVKDLFHKN